MRPLSAAKPLALTRSLPLIALILIVWAGVRIPAPARAATACDPLGWFPSDLSLKDHSVFWYDGAYYIVAINVDQQDHFAYARSTDFCNWEDLTPILSTRPPGSWEERYVWAPFVYAEGGTFYMYYTGVTDELTQSIMLATSTNPADPASWQLQGMVFQPDHPDMVWQNGDWADCRDPMVIKIEGVYYLYYTGMDTGGGIIGIATANSLLGPWDDWGAVTPPNAQSVPESPTTVLYGGNYYLFTTDSFQGEVLRIGATPAGPWKGPYEYVPGWAHEIWPDIDGNWYASYLTDYTVTISPLTWDTAQQPAWPFIGEQVFNIRMPLVLR